MQQELKDIDLSMAADSLLALAEITTPQNQALGAKTRGVKRWIGALIDQDSYKENARSKMKKKGKVYNELLERLRDRTKRFPRRRFQATRKNRPKSIQRCGMNTTRRAYHLPRFPRSAMEMRRIEIYNTNQRYPKFKTYKENTFAG